MLSKLDIKKVNFRSVDDLNAQVLKSLNKLPRDISLVVAVPRSGYIVAGLIALYLNVPMCSLNEYLQGLEARGGRRADKIKSQERSKILVVDDSVSSGWEIKRVREEFKQRVADSPNLEVLFLAAYVAEQSLDLVDIALEVLNPPQMFEWNLYHHPHLQNSCVDIDGVLCRDATKEEDDDGEAYINFLTQVEPRFVPAYKMGALVTSRLEKYRPQTEAWLKQHGFQYDQLIMQDLPDLEARRASGGDARFKANFYKSSPAFLFIESSSWQADEIAAITGKAVYCVDDRRFIQAMALEGKVWDQVKSAKQDVNRIKTSLIRRAKKAIFN